MAVISFKCPNCDGELIFDPSTQKYKCEYCFSLFSQEELDAMKPAQRRNLKMQMLRAQEKHQVNRRIRSRASREIKQVVEQKKITRKIKSQIKKQGRKLMQ